MKTYTIMTKFYIVDSITESFPNLWIPKIEEEFIYQLIKNTEKLIVKNAASIPSKLGGGKHTYLDLALLNEKYNTITRHNFVVHTNIGELLALPVANATQYTITQIN